MRIFAVPDIHGRLDLLLKLMETLKTVHHLDWANDRLIFMGDMIDRGPDSKGVVDLVRQLQKDHPQAVVALLGNHEEFCIKALRKGVWHDIDLWLTPCNGGAETLKSFRAHAAHLIARENPIPEDYLEWMENLKLSHEEGGFFFSHAPPPKEKNRPPHRRGTALSRDELIWTYEDDERGKARIHRDAQGNPLVGVCGHVHRLRQGVFAPRYYPHYLFLDAGCGCHPKAPLVCTEVQSRTPIWVWPDGVTPIESPDRSYIPKCPMPEPITKLE